MPFGHKAGFSRSYHYGGRSPGTRMPLAGRTEALAEMRRRNDLWNALVAIEHDHRERQSGALSALRAGPGWRDIQNKADRERERQSYNADPQIRAIYERCDAERRAAVMEAKHASGLFWCNADDVLASYGQARQEPGELAFHAFHGFDASTDFTGRASDRVTGPAPGRRLHPRPGERQGAPAQARHRALQTFALSPSRTTTTSPSATRSLSTRTSALRSPDSPSAPARSVPWRGALWRIAVLLMLTVLATGGR